MAVEATGNAMAVVRALEPHVARVIVANPPQVKAIAHARVKTDKIDAGVLASLRAADFLPDTSWLPDAETGNGGVPSGRAAQSGRPASHADQETKCTPFRTLIWFPPVRMICFTRVWGAHWLSRQSTS